MNRFATLNFFLLIAILTLAHTAEAQLSGTEVQGGATQGAPTSRLDDLTLAFASVDEGYPKYRYIDAGIQFLFGGLITYTGVAVLADNQASTVETVWGSVALGFGVLRLADGFYSAFAPRPIERSLSSFQENEDPDTTLGSGERALESSAKRERAMRYMRATLAGGSAAAYIALFAIDYKKYWVKGVVGGIIAAAALYKLFALSPAEKAWREYQETGEAKKEESRRVSFYFFPSPTSVAGGFHLAF